VLQIIFIIYLLRTVFLYFFGFLIIIISEQAASSFSVCGVCGDDNEAGARVALGQPILERKDLVRRDGVLLATVRHHHPVPQVVPCIPHHTSNATHIPNIP
jgi:hypothetical protein